MVIVGLPFQEVIANVEASGIDAGVLKVTVKCRVSLEAAGLLDAIYHENVHDNDHLMREAKVGCNLILSSRCQDEQVTALCIVVGWHKCQT